MLLNFRDECNSSYKKKVLSLKGFGLEGLDFVLPYKCLSILPEFINHLDKKTAKILIKLSRPVAAIKAHSRHLKCLQFSFKIIIILEKCKIL